MRRELNNRKVLHRDIDFSEKENAVIDALNRLQMARNVSRIAKEAGIARTTTAFILKKLEKREMAVRIAHKTKMGQRYVWRSKRIPSSANIGTLAADDTIIIEATAHLKH